jgi:Protein of unknown function (DUF3551)
MRLLTLSSALVAGTLIGAPQAAFAQSQEKAFCLESQSGLRNCIYDSVAQCQQALGGRAGECIANPARGTTGAGGGMNEPAPPPGPQNPPGGGQFLPPPSQSR